ncbi:hypothetical protein Hdeb2414_s0008g00281851 [Helianthus debilis subsp. tardiflorus]
MAFVLSLIKNTIKKNNFSIKLSLVCCTICLHKTTISLRKAIFYWNYSCKMYKLITFI